MPPLTKDKTREIIEDFAKEIRERKTQGPKPSVEVINFRTDIQDGKERPVWRVPIELLRFRKDNGRIASDVLDYERNTGILDERDAEAQAQIARFLEQKDPEKTEILTHSILHGGQRDPAIITCDGFLINGNRRKMVMDRLHHEHPGNDAFGYIKAVILPGKGEEGGPPTLLEIEKIENRYQLQSDGKSEYYGFDRALSIKRKVDLGLSLEEQLRDDPRYVRANKAEIERVVREYERDYLNPLQCVDRYLRQFKREGQYRTISTGMSDPEGRWQAFIDYSTAYQRYLSNQKKRIELGIEEDEIGAIEEAAFSIIRLRTVPDMPKVHEIMRELPKYCRIPEGKKEILKISEQVDPLLPREECFDSEGKPLSFVEVDAKWMAKHKQAIVYHLKKASRTHESQKERETPLGLLDAAYKKLTHDDMDLSTIAMSDYKKARDLAAQIKARAGELEGEIYHYEKRAKELKKLGGHSQ